LSPPKLLPQAILFDLDGTLLDTLADLADTANTVLEAQGYPTHAHDAYRQFIGDGVATLFRRALPAGEPEAHPHLIDHCAETFKARYAETWNRHTRPYDGVPALIETLHARSVPMAVLSNKPDEFTRRCIAHFFDPGAFRVIVGDRPGHPRKPHPDGALEIAAALGAAPSAVWYLGDSSVDMTTATRAGMVPLGAAWGFRSVEELLETGAQVILHRPHDLLDLIATVAA
jgi:phosphoglycolate phosphatase